MGGRKKERKKKERIMPLIVATYVCHEARLQRRMGSARTTLGPKGWVGFVLIFFFWVEFSYQIIQDRCTTVVQSTPLKSLLPYPLPKISNRNLALMDSIVMQRQTSRKPEIMIQTKSVHFWDPLVCDNMIPTL